MSEPFAIAEAEVIELALPLLAPFVTGFGATESRRVILVRLVDDEGHVGWGEAAPFDHPFYLPDTIAGAFHLIVEYALPMVLRTQIRSARDVSRVLSPIRGNGFARSAVEAAFWTLEAERTDCSLAELVGGSRTRIPVGESIGIKPSIDDTLEEVGLRLSEGYRRIKLKITPGWDVGVVRAVRESFGTIPLQVDANGSYELEQAGQLALLDQYDLVCLEQPLPFDALWEHAELQKRLATPICLDESLRSPRDVRTALELGACRNVNLKPGRVGGIAASLAIHDLCLESQVPLWCGGMLESGIGRAPNIALSSLPGFTQPADMSPASVLFAEDVVNPTYEVDPDGFVAVPTESGLGFPVAEDRVAAYSIRRDRVPIPDRKTMPASMASGRGLP